MSRRSAALTALTLVLLLTGPVLAEDNPATASAPAANSAEARKQEAVAAFVAAMESSTKGPAAIGMLGQATLNLPAGYVFVPRDSANRLMRAYGNSAGGSNFAGLIMPAEPSEPWFITADFEPAGYVKDEEAKNWDVEALLKNAQDGTEAGNEDRVARGFGKIRVEGWVEKPDYDAKEHRLVYSLLLKSYDAAPDEGGSVNYQTYALGREGYFSLDLVTGSQTIEQYKDRARTVLASLDYDQGKRYEDFVAGTDHVAEYGIAALVGGLAAKKLGLLALAGLAFVKFGKLIALGAVALLGGAATLFGRKKS